MGGQLTPYRLPLPNDSLWTPPDHSPPEPLYHILLGNETEIQKQMKILKLKNINERIHQIRKKCLIIQTFDIRHYMKELFQ